MSPAADPPPVVTAAPPAPVVKTRPAAGLSSMTPGDAQALQTRWADYLGRPVVERNSVGMDLVLIPPGEFETDPTHRFVHTRPFELGKTEVTRQLAMQLAFYLAPAINLYLIGRGALNIGLFVFDKRNRREAWQMALASTYRDHIIVCGLGKIGFRVVNQLIGDGHDVVAIDNRQDGPFNDLVQGRKVPVLIGDARQPELLEQAGIRRARSIAVRATRAEVP